MHRLSLYLPISLLKVKGFKLFCFENFFAIIATDPITISRKLCPRTQVRYFGAGCGGQELNGRADVVFLRALQCF